MKLCDFQFKRTENHNFTNNQYEPACGIPSLFDILLIELLDPLFRFVHVGHYVVADQGFPRVGGRRPFGGKVPTYDFALIFP